jgi:hypothetical protein
MFEILAYLIMLPLALLMDIFHWTGRYRQFHQRQQPREAELSKASHGAAVLAIVALALVRIGGDAINSFIGGLIEAPENPWNFAPALLLAGLVLWGLLWFVTGARRALWFASFRDGRLITRAVCKMIFGAAVYAVAWRPPSSWPPDVLAWIAWARALPSARFAIEALVIWLTVTGLVKFLLVMWRRISRAREQVAADIAAQGFDWDEV